MVDGDKWIQGESQTLSSRMDDDPIALEESDEAVFTLDLNESRIYITNIKKGEDIRYKFAATFYVACAGESMTMLDVEDCTLKQ